MNSKFKEQFISIQRLFEYYDNLPEQPHLGEERRLHQERVQLFYICQELVSPSFEAPFYKRHTRRHAYAEATELGRRILEGLQTVERLLAFQGSEPTFTPNIHCPQVDALIRAFGAALSVEGQHVEGIGFVSALPVRPDDYSISAGSEIDAAVSALNGLATQLRSALLSSGAQEAAKNFRRNATERYRHLMRVAEQQWKKHCKILLIRLDWGFRKTYPAYRIRFKTQSDFERQMAEVDSYRRQMLRILKKTFKQELALYAWKLECGDIKGIHIHWLIGLDASEHQDGRSVGRQIAKSFDTQVGNGKSYTFNINGKRGAGASGLRVIDYHDPELWVILGRYCDYLTKVDYTLKLRMPGRMRSFGCSKLKSTSRRSSPGPKRRFTMPPLNFSQVRPPKSHRTSRPHQR